MCECQSLASCCQRTTEKKKPHPEIHLAIRKCQVPQQGGEAEKEFLLTIRSAHASLVVHHSNRGEWNPSWSAHQSGSGCSSPAATWGDVQCPRRSPDLIHEFHRFFASRLLRDKQERSSTQHSHTARLNASNGDKLPTTAQGVDPSRKEGRALRMKKKSPKVHLNTTVGQSKGSSIVLQKVTQLHLSNLDGDLHQCATCRVKSKRHR